MVDPLSILREYNVNKKPVVEKNNQIIFGEYSWPKTVKTNYLELWRKKAAVKNYYTLESLLFFLKNAHLFHPEYVKKAVAENIPAVKRPDRKELLAYLNGEISTSEGIDKSAPIVMPTTVKRVCEEQNQQEVVKKPRCEQKIEISGEISASSSNHESVLTEVPTTVKHEYEEQTEQEDNKKICPEEKNGITGEISASSSSHESVLTEIPTTTVVKHEFEELNEEEDVEKMNPEQKNGINGEISTSCSNHESVLPEITTTAVGNHEYEEQNEEEDVEKMSPEELPSMKSSGISSGSNENVTAENNAEVFNDTDSTIRDRRMTEDRKIAKTKKIEWEQIEAKLQGNNTSLLAQVHILLKHSAENQRISIENQKKIIENQNIILNILKMKKEEKM